MERVLRPTPLYLSSMNLHSFRHIFWLMCASICSTLVWGQTPQGSLPKEILNGRKRNGSPAHWTSATLPSFVAFQHLLRATTCARCRVGRDRGAHHHMGVYEGQPTFPCILKQIASAATQECRVVVFSENVSQTTSYLSSNNCGGAVLMDSVDVVDATYSSIWIRDYGANTVYTEYNDGRCSSIGCTTVHVPTTTPFQMPLQNTWGWTCTAPLRATCLDGHRRTGCPTGMAQDFPPNSFSTKTAAGTHGGPFTPTTPRQDRRHHV